MESQLHRHHDDLHDEQKRGGETKSAIKKVKEKVEKLNAAIHGHHEDDDTKIVNDSPPVRSGMVQPTVMGTPVLAEDLYATHSDIVDPPVRSFAQWEEEERQGAAPPLPTGYGTHFSGLSPAGDYPVHGQAASSEQIEQLEENRSAPNLTTVVSPAIKVADQSNTGGKEAGITGVLKSFDKMSVYDESHSKSSDQNEPEMYRGSHDQFAPAKPVEAPPPDTVTGNPPNPTTSHAQKAASAAAAAAEKGVVASNLGFSGENKTDKNSSSFSTSDFAHKVADAMTGTLVPVYEKVVGAKSAVVSKIQGSDGGGSTAVESPEGKKITVREYLVGTFTPGEEDKVLSEKITNVFHRGKGNNVAQDEEGERRLQDSSN